MKKVAVVILIFILLAIAPQVGELYDWFRDTTPVVVSAVNNTVASISITIGSTVASIGGAAPAMAPATTQPQVAQATATPSPSPEPTPTPTPSATPTPSPSPTATPEADLFGSITGQTYVNDTVGLQLDFPKGYTALDKQAIKENIVKNTPNLKDAYNDPEKFNEMVKAGEIPVFVASKHPIEYTKGFNSNFSVTISQINDQLSLKDIADYVKKTLFKTDGYSNVKNPQNVTIDGNKSFLITATVKVQKLKVSQKIYLLQNKNWFITITLGSTSTTEMSEMTKTVQSVKIIVPTASIASTASAEEESVDPGSISGLSYTNKIGGFVVGFPAGYTATTDAAAIKKYDIDGFAVHKSIYKDPDAVKQSIEAGGTSALFIAYRHPKGLTAGLNDKMSVSMINMDGFTGSALEYASYAKQDAKYLSDKVTVEDPVAVQIAGLKGAVLQSSYKIGSYLVQDEAVIFEKNRYLVLINLTAVDNTGMKELEQALGTLRILTGA
jgi:hypothetical protein